MARREPKPKSARAARRQSERALARAAARADARFLEQPGGSPAHPLIASSGSVVESAAGRVPCPRCEGSLGVLEHDVKKIDSELLRRIRVRCSRCGGVQTLWVKVETRTLQ